MAKRYYVYLITDDKGKALYVGKGTGSRFMQHMQRDEFKDLRMLHTHVHFVADEASALQAERELVQHYGLDNLLNVLMPSGVVPDALATKQRNNDGPSKADACTSAKKRRDPFYGMAKPPDVTSATWQYFVELRKMKKSPVNELVIQRLREEASKADLSLEDALQICVFRGWAGLKAEWLIGPTASNSKRCEASGRFAEPI
jgi:hypothetical protein